MILHSYFRSSASFRVRIALNLKGVSYEQATHHLRKGEQRDLDYLALNPQGLVPALEHDGRIFTQSMAIIEYLDEAMPDPPLLPNNAIDRAHVRALAQAIACDVTPLDNLRVLKYLRGELGQDQPAVTAWYNHWIALGFESVEAVLARDPRTGRYCCGDRPGLADICLIPQAFNARTFDLDMRPYPLIQQIVDACLSLPAFDLAQPSHQPDAE